MIFLLVSDIFKYNEEKKSRENYGCLGPSEVLKTNFKKWKSHWSEFENKYNTNCEY